MRSLSVSTATKRVVALLVGAVAVVAGGVASFFIAGLLGGATLATGYKVIDLVLAGATVAAAVGAVFTGGLAAVTGFLIRSAITTMGRDAAAT